VPGCKNAVDTPTGLIITQSGNVITITTNGQCIKLPEYTDYCGIFDQPSSDDFQPELTGISVLTRSDTTLFKITGIESDLPGILDSFNTVEQDFFSCLINYPSDAASSLSETQIYNTDVCYDVTDSYLSFSDIPGITVNPPVTNTIVSTTSVQIVSDCFATNADSIFDHFTNESWTRGADGTFVKNEF